MNIEIRALSSLEKLFLHQEPSAPAPVTEGFQNEVISWQLAMILREGERSQQVAVEVDAPCAQALHVRHVPVQLTTYDDADDNYLSKASGLYPDLLARPVPHSVRVYASHWECLWITFDPQGELPAGEYPVTVRVKEEDGTVLGEHTQTVRLLSGLLPKQQLQQTRWFHADCLADYYHVPALSEEHWRIVENFVRCAVEGGMNVMLMPTHTPPLDTRVGGERTTVQLVGIAVENGEYRFDMSKVRRWIDMCRRCGVEYYEVAHLFTQWGAQHAPKIMATVDGKEERIFGWETDAAGEEYGAFLRAYVPALRQVFREEGIEDKVWWHISDEPSPEHLAHYLAAKKQVEELLRGAKIMDALSSYEFYRQGVVQHPVVASDHMQAFLENHVPGLWMYYCCGQYRDVANVFIAHSSTRCRVLGAQLYRYGLEGFLQWGFNFYNAQYSDYPIDPYACTDADGFVPAGDPFLVYPGRDGQPELSIRYMACREAMQDLRALCWLESLIGREQTDTLLGDLTLSAYMTDPEELLALRRKVNALIVENT